MQKIKPSNLSLVNQAYQELKRSIQQHKIPLGGKLNEGELATALGISRTPVREAKKTSSSSSSSVRTLKAWPHTWLQKR
jgi:DNA-binding FadR family transcriptional regulator